MDHTINHGKVLDVTCLCTMTYYDNMLYSIDSSMDATVSVPGLVVSELNNSLKTISLQPKSWDIKDCT